MTSDFFNANLSYQTSLSSLKNTNNKDELTNNLNTSILTAKNNPEKGIVVRYFKGNNEIHNFTQAEFLHGLITIKYQLSPFYFVSDLKAINHYTANYTHDIDIDAYWITISVSLKKPLTTWEYQELLNKTVHTWDTEIKKYLKIDLHIPQNLTFDYIYKGDLKSTPSIYFYDWVRKKDWDNSWYPYSRDGYYKTSKEFNLDHIQWSLANYHYGYKDIDISTDDNFNEYLPYLGGSSSDINNPLPTNFDMQTINHKSDFSTILWPLGYVPIISTPYEIDGEYYMFCNGSSGQWLQPYGVSYLINEYNILPRYIYLPTKVNKEVFSGYIWHPNSGFSKDEANHNIEPGDIFYDGDNSNYNNFLNVSDTTPAEKWLQVCSDGDVYYNRGKKVALGCNLALNSVYSDNTFQLNRNTLSTKIFTDINIKFRNKYKSEKHVLSSPKTLKLDNLLPTFDEQTITDNPTSNPNFFNGKFQANKLITIANDTNIIKNTVIGEDTRYTFSVKLRLNTEYLETLIYRYGLEKLITSNKLKNEVLAKFLHTIGLIDLTDEQWNDLLGWIKDGKLFLFTDFNSVSDKQARDYLNSMFNLTIKFNDENTKYKYTLNWNSTENGKINPNWPNYLNLAYLFTSPGSYLAKYGYQSGEITLPENWAILKTYLQNTEELNIKKQFYSFNPKTPDNDPWTDWTFYSNNTIFSSVSQLQKTLTSYLSFNYDYNVDFNSPTQRGQTSGYDKLNLKLFDKTNNIIKETDFTIKDLYDAQLKVETDNDDGAFNDTEHNKGLEFFNRTEQDLNKMSNWIDNTFKYDETANNYDVHLQVNNADNNVPFGWMGIQDHTLSYYNFNTNDLSQLNSFTNNDIHIQMYSNSVGFEVNDADNWFKNLDNMAFSSSIKPSLHEWNNFIYGLTATQLYDLMTNPNGFDTDHLYLDNQGHPITDEEHTITRWGIVRNISPANFYSCKEIFSTDVKKFFANNPSAMDMQIQDNGLLINWKAPYFKVGEGQFNTINMKSSITNLATPLSWGVNAKADLQLSTNVLYSLADKTGGSFANNYIITSDATSKVQKQGLFSVNLPSSAFYAQNLSDGYLTKDLINQYHGKYPLDQLKAKVAFFNDDYLDHFGLNQPTDNDSLTLTYNTIINIPHDTRGIDYVVNPTRQVNTSITYKNYHLYITPDTTTKTKNFNYDDINDGRENTIKWDLSQNFQNPDVITINPSSLQVVFSDKAIDSSLMSFTPYFEYDENNHPVKVCVKMKLLHGVLKPFTSTFYLKFKAQSGTFANQWFTTGASSLINILASNNDLKDYNKNYSNHDHNYLLDKDDKFNVELDVPVVYWEGNDQTLGGNDDIIKHQTYTYLSDTSSSVIKWKKTTELQNDNTTIYTDESGLFQLTVKSMLVNMGLDLIINLELKLLDKATDLGYITINTWNQQKANNIVVNIGDSTTPPDPPVPPTPPSPSGDTVAKISLILGLGIPSICLSLIGLIILKKKKFKIKIN